MNPHYAVLCDNILEAYTQTAVFYHMVGQNYLGIAQSVQNMREAYRAFRRIELHTRGFIGEDELYREMDIIRSRVETPILNSTPTHFDILTQLNRLISFVSHIHNDCSITSQQLLYNDENNAPVINEGSILFVLRMLSESLRHFHGAHVELARYVEENARRALEGGDRLMSDRMSKRGRH